MLEARKLLSAGGAAISGSGDATGTISGTLYNDLNNNNVQDTGESGLAGWTVFLDTNKNGRLDPGELSTTTNASGGYTFTGVPLGTYQVAEVLPSGFIQTVPGATGLSPGVVTSVTLSSSKPRASAADLRVSAVLSPRATTNYVVNGISRLGSVPIPGAATSSSGAINSAFGVADTPALLAKQNVTPSQYDNAYGLTGLTFGSVPANGAGQTIAIIDAYNDPDIAGDLAEFDAYFGVAAPPSFEVVSQTGSTTALPADSGSTGWSLEESLDVEWAHAVAPAASIILVEANSATDSDLYAGVDWARNAPDVSVVSMSFSGDEYNGVNATDDYHFTTPPGHPGVSFLAATGDYGKYAGEGSTAVLVGYPAQSSYVVAVGGTTLRLSNSSGAYGTETGWGNGTASYTSGGSGGGVSLFNPQPPYQTGVVTQSSTHRTIPDISLDADPATGAELIDSYDYPGYLVGVGGTSFATPSLAGMIAIANQGRELAGEAPLDGPTQTLPAIYQLPSSDFHDITSGNNGYAAGTGYDLVTGRGSPIANLFIPGLVSFNAQQAVHELTVSISNGSLNSTNQNFPDQFTDLPPTVATAPTAVPSGGSGTLYNLNVLGASAAGEASLTYLWSVGAGAPGSVVFGANNTNAAKATSASFSAAGTYTLTVQITDAQGLNIAASVQVNITPTFSSLNGSTLTITGTSGSDAITLSTTPTQLNVLFNGVSAAPVALSLISGIQILGGDGNDLISLATGVPATNIVGGAGIDTVNSASTALVTFTDSNATGGLVASGIGTLTLNAINAFDAATINAGTLAVTVAGALAPACILIDDSALTVSANNTLAGLSGTGGVTIGNDSVLQLAPGSGTATIGALTINSGSELDITNNAILVNETANPLANIGNLINTGSNGGLWNGTGIVSSTAATTPNRTVGFGDSTGIPAVPVGFAEAKFTVPGDVNLDGVVDIFDYTTAVNNFNLIAGYQGGDIANQGYVNSVDIGIIVNNFGLSLS